MGILNKFLSFFTGTTVKIIGIVLSVVLGALFLEGAARIAYLACIAFTVIALLFPDLFHWLANFADPVNWPPFVALGIAIVIAAHVGGSAVFAVLGPLTTYDGMYFEQNY